MFTEDQKCDYYGNQNQCPVAKFLNTGDGEKIRKYLDGFPNSPIGKQICNYLTESEVSYLSKTFKGELHVLIQEDVTKAFNTCLNNLCENINSKLNEHGAKFKVDYNFGCNIITIYLIHNK